MTVDKVVQCEKLISQHQYKKSEQILRRSLAKQPRCAHKTYLLGLSLFKQNRFKHAQNFLVKSINLPNGPRDAYLLLADLYSRSNSIALAIETLTTGQHHYPNDREIALSLARKLIAKGKKAEALISYQSALKNNPRDVYAYHEYLVNDGPEITEASIAALQIYKDFKADPVDRATAGYCCFRTEETATDTVASGKLLKHASQIFRGSYKYNSAADVRHLVSIRDYLTSDVLSRYSEAGYSGSNHIFVLGMPRSGTTLVEQILATHTAVKGLGELGIVREIARETLVDEQGKLTLQKLTDSKIYSLGKAYSRAVSEGVDRNIITVDKMPHNFMWVGLIAMILPNAKIIHCTRSPMDNCFSLYKSLFGVGLHKYSYRLEELAEYYAGYRTLMHHWKSLLGCKVYDFQYEKLIANPEPVVRGLLGHCELSWQEECLRFHDNQTEVKTLSVSQVSRPLYDSSIKSWEKHKTLLAPLEQKLQDLKVI